MTKFSQYSLALWVGMVHASSAQSSSSSNDEDDDRFKADTKIEFGSSCGYKLTFSFEHDEELPLGTPQLCVPGSIAPEDGLPYLAGRGKEYKFSDEIFEATGLASHAIEFVPCGHPPFPAFGGPHYDSHFYTTTERESWTCAISPVAPVCNFNEDAQTTPRGLAFFDVATVGSSDTYSNMPAGFSCDPTAAVPQMGQHCWNFDTNPASFDEWDTPTHVMGSYDADIAFFEVMYSVNYVTGNEDNTYSDDDIEYEGQTIPTLPSRYEVNYVAANNRTTIILHGTHANCGSDVPDSNANNSTVEEDISKDNDGTSSYGDGSTSGGWSSTGSLNMYSTAVGVAISAAVLLQC